MGTAALLASVTLAFAFAIAGAAKLVDRHGSREALSAFGVPRPLLGAFSVGVPAAEIVIAAALLAPDLVQWGALGALALLLVFCFGIVRAIWVGTNADCHCFGQLHSAPVGWPTLARNGALAALAAFAFGVASTRAVPDLFTGIADLSGTAVLALLAALLIAGLAYFCLQLLRQHGRLMLRVDALEQALGTGGMALGSPAPPFRLSDLDGRTVTREDLLADGKPLMMLFTNPDCGPCTALLPEVSAWQREYNEELTIAVISEGGPKLNRLLAAEHLLENLLLQREREVLEAYSVPGTPGAVLVARQGEVASAPAAGVAAIRELLARTVGTSNGRPRAVEAGIR